jgi:hypothetical protein
VTWLAVAYSRARSPNQASSTGGNAGSIPTPPILAISGCIERIWACTPWVLTHRLAHCRQRVLNFPNGSARVNLAEASDLIYRDALDKPGHIARHLAPAG